MQRFDTIHALGWRKQPPFDAEYLRNPDAGLLSQDHEKEPPEFPSGYTPLRAWPGEIP